MEGCGTSLLFFSPVHGTVHGRTPATRCKTFFFSLWPGQPFFHLAVLGDAALGGPSFSSMALTSVSCKVRNVPAPFFFPLHGGLQREKTGRLRGHSERRKSDQKGPFLFFFFPFSFLPILGKREIQEVFKVDKRKVVQSFFSFLYKRKLKEECPLFASPTSSPRTPDEIHFSFFFSFGR